MANAFKCDICGQYEMGSSYTVSIIPPFVSARVTTFDMCEDCFIAMNKTLVERRGESIPEFKEYL